MSGYWPAPWGQQCRRSRCQWRTGWPGRSTWGCGREGLSQWPGWWAGSQHSDQVHGQEEPEEERLLFWVWREAREQEVRVACLISDFHWKWKNIWKILLKYLKTPKSCIIQSLLSDFSVCFVFFFPKFHRDALMSLAGGHVNKYRDENSVQWLGDLGMNSAF